CRWQNVEELPRSKLCETETDCFERSNIDVAEHSNPPPLQIAQALDHRPNIAKCLCGMLPIAVTSIDHRHDARQTCCQRGPSFMVSEYDDIDQLGRKTNYIIQRFVIEIASASG